MKANITFYVCTEHTGTAISKFPSIPTTSLKH